MENNLEQYIGKTYIRKNVEHGIENEPFKILSIDNNFFVCSNQYRIKLDTLLNDFIEYSENINENNNNKISEINPDTFFDMQKYTPFVIGPDDNSPATELPQPPAHMMNNTPMPPAHMVNNNMSHQTHMNIDNKNQEIIKSEYIQPVQLEQKQIIPEHETFNRVLKTENVLLNIPIMVSLPKADSMKVMNELYNISFTGYLAKQIVNDNINGSTTTLQRTIQAEIEKWMDNQLNDTKQSKKKTSKKKTIIVEDKPVEDKPVEDKPELTKVEENKTKTDVKKLKKQNDFVLPGMFQSWDGNVDKLLLIATEEQYNAVKNKYELIKNANTPLKYKLEGMLETYEMENKKV